jgi:putative SOS response-associated peptidase YedK
MCGRFSRTSPAEVIVERFGVTTRAAVDLRARYNVCPGEDVAALIEHQGDRRLGPLRWGFPPRSQINVRSESVARASAFRDAFRRRRCVVVVDGFFEWRSADSLKQPHFFRLTSHQPFGLAGIWQRPPGGELPPGAALLTCAANSLVACVHDRMPVMLTPDDCGRWLDPRAHPTALESLLRSFPSETMEGYPVSALVNSGRNDSPDCVRPIGGRLRLVPPQALR